MSRTTVPFPPARRQTYTFLRDARRTAHVYLLAEVDAAALRAAREAAGRPSYVSYVIKAAAEVLAGYPDARAVLSDGARPRLTVFEDVHAKVLFDRTIDGQRCVLSGTVESAQARTIEQIQAAIDGYKQASVDGAGPFASVRRLQRLPLPIAWLLYRIVLRDPARRNALQGTFAVTSVGQEPVQVILPMITGTLGFGVGRIADSPVVRDGEIVVAPVLTLSLTFDHRVLDGAMAAEILGRVKDRLEHWEQ
ncbi:2-oxo acid dehydrogenase subunit E2 [Dactylosporangium sp. NPDC049525]|uniref:2-oxo acid dehydrogenase subunit E2 n=1 Tax=Dactylosporangium sp. NPDC049525 TaxID=3154730 RepID=UPI00342978C1